MLSTMEITKMYKGTKITLRADLYKAKKSGSKSSQTGSAGEQCCEISQPAKFAGCEFFATLPNSTNSSLSSAFLLQMSFEMIMHLRVRLEFVVFELARRK